MKMTSTQRSESANSLLKKYVPPSSPMHMFVRHYIQLQFDREFAENFEERRSRIVSRHIAFVVLDFAKPLDQHV